MNVELTDNEKQRLERMSARLKNICNVQMGSKQGTMIMLDVKPILMRAAAEIDFLLAEKTTSSELVTC